MGSFYIGLTLLATLYLCQAAVPRFFNPFNQRTPPRCISQNKPCRLRVDMEDEMSMATEPCSCPSSKVCSDDWEGQRDHVIIRELNIDTYNMTISMMFCNAIQPQRTCDNGEVALEVNGLSHVPSEVSSIRCACSDSRPLVRHSEYYGNDHRLYMSFVCANAKRQCRVRSGIIDVCMTDENDVMSYPCRCPAGFACNTRSYDGEHFYNTCTSLSG